jgi:hypothetical protein
MMSSMGYKKNDRIKVTAVKIGRKWVRLTDSGLRQLETVEREGEYT